MGRLVVRVAVSAGLLTEVAVCGSGSGVDSFAQYVVGICCAASSSSWLSNQLELVSTACACVEELQAKGCSGSSYCMRTVQQACDQA